MLEVDKYSDAFGTMSTERGAFDELGAGADDREDFHFI